MAYGDVSDFTIRYKGHPKYNSRAVIENEPVEVIVQKLENMLFTNRGQVMGDAGEEFGGDVEYMLWGTELPNNIMKMRLVNQINKYIPELPAMGYSFDIKLYEGQVSDTMRLEFVINGYNVNFVLEK